MQKSEGQIRRDNDFNEIVRAGSSETILND